MELHLRRTKSHKTCTISPLFIDDATERECYILEDIVREVVGVPVSEWKVANSTAIPCGRYRVFWTHSKHFDKWMPELKDVPGFTGVRIHSGNKAADTEGCLITGTVIGQDGESVLNSRAARDSLYEIIHDALSVGKEVWITVE